MSPEFVVESGLDEVFGGLSLETSGRQGCGQRGGVVATVSKRGCVSRLM